MGPKTPNSHTNGIPAESTLPPVRAGDPGGGGGVTHVWFKFNAPERELEFVRWTPRYLIVKFPPTSRQAGQDWRMGRKLVNQWLASGVLRIEGEIPEWALII